MQVIGVGREFFGHEADFDERAHAICEQAVVDLIDVGKVVDRVPVRIEIVDANLIVKDGVKTDVAEICN